MTPVLLSYYDKNGTRIAGEWANIPAKCISCKTFKYHKKCSNSNGFSQCKHGFSVYKDDEKNTFFGLKIVGYFDPYKITKKDVDIILTTKTFLRLIEYMKQKNKGDFFPIFEIFCKNYDRCMEDLKHVFSINTKENIVQIESEAIDAAQNAIREISNLRQETISLLEGYKWGLFESYPSNNHFSGYVFEESPECAECNPRSCANIVDDNVKKCNRGYAVYLYEDKLYCGYQIKKHFNSKKPIRELSLRTTFELSTFQHLLKSSTNELEKIPVFKRFLHDLGQYSAGLSNTLPVSTGYPAQYLSSDIKSIKAFIDAMFSLKQHIYKLLCGIPPASKHRVFAPYQLFDKYRLCFETHDTQIKLLTNANERFEHKTAGLDGFEFVVLNLIANAVKYLPKHNLDNRKIEIKFSKKENIEIKIASYGPPVKAAEIKHLSKPGFRGENAIKYGIKGEGGGLAYIAEHIEQSGYLINFESLASDYIEDYRKQYWLFVVTITILQDNQPGAIHLTEDD